MEGKKIFEQVYQSLVRRVETIGLSRYFGNDVPDDRGLIAGIGLTGGPWEFNLRDLCRTFEYVKNDVKTVEMTKTSETRKTIKMSKTSKTIKTIQTRKKNP